MEFSEYLQLDRMAHWPRFLRHPVYIFIHHNYGSTRKKANLQQKVKNEIITQQT